MKIGPKIKELRKLRGLTQAQLAEKIQATEGRISNWERGENNPDKEILGPLAEALGVRISDLYSDEEDEKHTPAKKVGTPEDISPERYVRDLQRLTDYQEKKIAELEKELAQFRRKG